MTTYAYFKPSFLFLDAGETGQQSANAANTFKPFLPQEARQSIEGIDKGSQAIAGTLGREIMRIAIRDFGFDEAEPDVTTSEVELISTDDSQIVDNMNPRFSDFVSDSLRPSDFVIKGGEALQQNGWVGAGEGIATVGHVMRAFGYDEAEAIDPLMGSQMSTTSAFYQDAMDVGNESVGVEPTDFVGWWNVDSSDMVAAEGSQFDDTFKSLSASDLPTAPDADSMANLSLPLISQQLQMPIPGLIFFSN